MPTCTNLTSSVKSSSSARNCQTLANALVLPTLKPLPATPAPTPSLRLTTTTAARARGADRAIMAIPPPPPLTNVAAYVGMLHLPTSSAFRRVSLCAKSATSPFTLPRASRRRDAALRFAPLRPPLLLHLRCPVWPPVLRMPRSRSTPHPRTPVPLPERRHAPLLPRTCPRARSFFANAACSPLRLPCPSSIPRSLVVTP